MASIQDYLDLIKNAIYGKDVRQAIHDGILQCYLDASGAHYEDLERNYANLEHNDKQLEQKYEELKLNKVNQPLGNNNQPVYGVAGQTLRTRGDGKTEWADVGVPTDSQTDRAVSNWLDRHPEATTTVEDGALTYKKLVNGTLGYVTPEMYGAEGDGSTDDTSSFISALGANLPVHLLSGKIYVISELDILSSIQIYGNGATLKRKPNADYAIKFSGDGGLLENIVVDGNMDSDDISATGIWITGDNVTLKNAEVFNCRNAEDAHAGIFLDGANDCILSRVVAHDNDRSAIMLDSCTNCIIENVLGYDNLGSAVTSGRSHYCTYRDIEVFSNGYSALSVNGDNCTVDNVVSYNNGYAGVNLGHNTLSGGANHCRVRNVVSYGNTYEGILVQNSKDVKIDNAILYENVRNNTRLMYDSEVTFENCRFYNSPGQGIFVDDGYAVVIDCESFENASGIYVNKTRSAKIVNSNFYNNTGTGIMLDEAEDTIVENCKSFDDQVSPTQDNGIWLSSCTNIELINNAVYDNDSYQIRQSGTNTNIKIYDNSDIAKAVRAVPFGLVAVENVTIDNNRCLIVGKHIFGEFTVTPTASIAGGAAIAKINLSGAGISVTAGQMPSAVSKWNGSVVSFANVLNIDASGNIIQNVGTMSSTSVFRFDYYID